MNNEELAENEIEYAERPNKTVLKKEFQALQVLANQMIALPESKLRQFPLSENTFDSLQQSVKIKSKNALRRHIRYLAKLLAKEDTVEIYAYFDKVAEQQTRNSHFFHQLERWRDRLMAQDANVLDEIIQQYPQLDRQYLHSLVRQANKEQQRQQAPKSSRKIFKYLREISE
jgi:ribosome-associated protein